MSDPKHKPIVQKLVDCYKDSSNYEFKIQFDEAMTLALKTGLDVFKKYNINSVEDYFSYMDTWLVDYAEVMGSWMGTECSITKESIETFRNAKNYKIDHYIEPDGGWKTFNEFFARHLKDGMRCVEPDTSDSVVIVSPADCAYDGQWDVDGAAEVTAFAVKGVPWNISQLLNDCVCPDTKCQPSDCQDTNCQCSARRDADCRCTKYGPLFAGGIFTHSFLGPQDYHRQHAPVSGLVKEAKIIPGACYLEVVLKEDDSEGGGPPKLHMHRPLYSKRHVGGIIPIEEAVGSEPIIDAPDTAGYQFLQARALILIDNPDLGLVAVLPIGMAQVSSVVLSVVAGDTVEKGQEISYFQFGGSDIIMVFEKDSDVNIYEGIKPESQTHYNYGEKIGTAPKKHKGH